MQLFSLLGNAATDSLEHVLGFTHARQKVMADNVANLDTPGYRMKDLRSDDFDKYMAQALERSQRANPNIFRLEAPRLDQLEGDVSHRHPDAEALRGIVFHDDNDRMIEKLMVKMQDNASKASEAAMLLRNQIRLLRAVITEQVA